MAESESVEPHEAASHLFRAGNRNPGVSGIRAAAISSGTRPAISVSLEPGHSSAGASGQRNAVVEGKVASLQSRHILYMAFGLPLMTAAISMGSMYLGHLITTQSDRPTNVLVSPAATPISVNVPQQKAPVIEVRPSEANIQVHVPQGAAPNVTFTAPAAAPPNITVNPPPATVTVIERKEERREEPPAAAPVDKAVATPGTATAASTATATGTSTDHAVPAVPPGDHTATPATTPAKTGEQPKLTPAKGNGSGSIPPIHETRPLINVSHENPDVALVAPAPSSSKPEDETLQGDVLPRTPAEIARQQADDAKRKK